jgi:hypothetical protein
MGYSDGFTFWLGSGSFLLTKLIISRFSQKAILTVSILLKWESPPVNSSKKSSWWLIDHGQWIKMEERGKSRSL